MNRPIKFRVWDIKNKKFLPESYFAILGNGKLIVTLSGYYNDLLIQTKMIMSFNNILA